MTTEAIRPKVVFWHFSGWRYMLLEREVASFMSSAADTPNIMPLAICNQEKIRQNITYILSDSTWKSFSFRNRLETQEVLLSWNIKGGKCWYLRVPSLSIVSVPTSAWTSGILLCSGNEVTKHPAEICGNPTGAIFVHIDQIVVERAPCNVSVNYKISQISPTKE